MEPRKIPRGTFWLGAFATSALVLPLTTTVLYLMAQHLGIGDAQAPMDRILVLSGIFAGLPTFVAGGGVARLVAHRLAERGADIGKGVGIATFAGAMVGLGAVILTAVALGGLPEKRLYWAPVPLAGVLVGATSGAAVGILVSMRQRRLRR